MENLTGNFFQPVLNDQSFQQQQQPSYSGNGAQRGFNPVVNLQLSSTSHSTGLCSYHHRLWAPVPNVWDSDCSDNEASVQERQQHSDQNRPCPSVTTSRARVSIFQQSLPTAGPEPGAWDTDASDEDIIDQEQQHIDQKRQRLSMPTLDASPLALEQQQQQTVPQQHQAEASTSSEQHHQNDMARQRHNELSGRRIFVGGLTDDITMAAILTHFEQFGQIREIIITKMRENNPQAVLTFFTVRQAREALQGRHFFTLTDGGQRRWFVRMLDD